MATLRDSSNHPQVGKRIFNPDDRQQSLNSPSIILANLKRNYGPTLANAMYPVKCNVKKTLNHFISCHVKQLYGGEFL